MSIVMKPTSHVVTGTVVKLSSEKTIKVAVFRQVIDPVTKRRFKRRSFFLVHDEHGVAKEGEEVRFFSCRPLSKRKCWCLVTETA